MKQSELRHAVRNWTDGIRLAAQVLPQLSDSDKQRRMLDNIVLSAQQCGRVIEAFLDQEQEGQFDRQGQPHLNCSLELLAGWMEPLSADLAEDRSAA
jgi:hypothetical protein